MKSLEALKAQLTELKPKLQQDYHVTELGIFGSYIRGEQTEESDVDVLIDFEPSFRFGLVTFCNIENQISDTLGEKVDLVMKRALKPRIGAQILKEVIYL